MIYIIERITRRQDGSTHERELRRKGHRVSIVTLMIGAPMIAVYVDDDNKVLTTSNVILISRFGDVLKVSTSNSVYTLREAGDSVCQTPQPQEPTLVSSI